MPNPKPFTWQDPARSKHFPSVLLVGVEMDSHFAMSGGQGCVATDADLRAAGWVPADEAQAAIDQGNATIKDCRWFLFEFAARHGLQDELKAALVARLAPAPEALSVPASEEGGPTR